MDPFQSRFESSLRGVAPVSPGETLMVALSGGADSTALLHLLVRAASSLGVIVTAAHLDHALREESPFEASFCRALCNRLAVPLLLERAPALPGSGSLQMRARRYRYAFFKRAAQSCGARWIVQAHHQDDVLETVFHKLLTGCAPAGLASIPARRGIILRPLLDYRHQELVAWLEEAGEEWVEDASNSKNGYERNYIRNVLFPELTAHWPAFRGAVARLSSLAAAENRFWGEYFADRGLPGIDQDGAIPPIPLALLREMEEVPLSRYLALVINRFGRLPARAFFNRVSELLRDDRRRIWLEGKGWSLYAADGYLYADRHGPAAGVVFSTRLSGATADLPWGRLTLAEESLAGMPGRKFFQEQAKNGIFFFDTRGIEGAVKVRSRAPGDRIPLAGGGSRKIKDILIDAAVPRKHRDMCTVLEDGAGIFAFLLPSLPGKSRLAPRVMVAGSARVLRIRVETGREKDNPTDAERMC